MTYDYETCRDNLVELCNWYTQHEAQRNEASTRLHLIDDLFLKCLSWSKEDIISEEAHSGEYADYTFLAPRRMLIVEAKKEGNYFELPIGQSKLEHGLHSLLRDYPNLKAAIEQVTNYCHLRGVPFAAVCNGHQIVTFVATRNDGTSPFEGKALVFSSLSSMLDNFLELWQVLSNPGVEDRQLQTRLLENAIPEVPSKLSRSIVNYPGVKDRNPFQSELQVLSEIVIENLPRHPELEAEFIRECYCQSGALSQYSLMAKSILQARYAALFDAESPGPSVVPAETKGGISNDLFVESLSKRPILLLGDVGVGKTSFIRNLIKVDGKQAFENAVTLYFDLGSKAALSTDLRAFLIQDIAAQLLRDYDIDIQDNAFVRGVYHSELQRFTKGIYSYLRENNIDAYRMREIEMLEAKLRNEEEHLKSSLEHIYKGRKRQIIVFLDNADQRDDYTQQLSFLIAQEFAVHWPVLAFVTLRPETFHASQQKGTLSGYHPKAFTISPPRVDLVLDKRLSFALRLTSGEIPINLPVGDVRVSLSKLDAILRVFLDTIRERKELPELLENLSGGNIRLSLDFVRNFLGSGHVNTEKIVNIYEETGKYTIPQHEFLRAILYGDAEYYHPDRTAIANLFDVSYPDPKEHFILPLLLGNLASSSSATSEAGFVDTSVVYDKLQGLGFAPEQIDSAIVRGCRKKLIETKTRREPKLDNWPLMLRATTVGLYHVQRLCSEFTYIDAVIIDIPILDPDIRAAIRNSWTLSGRLDNVETFCNYLDSHWPESFSEQKTYFDWPNASRTVKKHVSFIRTQRLGRN